MAYVNVPHPQGASKEPFWDSDRMENILQNFFGKLQIKVITLCELCVFHLLSQIKGSGIIMGGINYMRVNLCDCL